jgi:hypothetical protein
MQPKTAGRKILLPVSRPLRDCPLPQDILCALVHRALAITVAAWLLKPKYLDDRLEQVDPATDNFGDGRWLRTER